MKSLTFLVTLLLLVTDSLQSKSNAEEFQPTQKFSQPVAGIESVSPLIDSIHDPKKPIQIRINYENSVSYSYTKNRKIRIIEVETGLESFSFDPEPGIPLEGRDYLEFSIPPYTLSEATDYIVTSDRTLGRFNVPPWRLFAIDETRGWTFSTLETDSVDDSDQTILPSPGDTVELPVVVSPEPLTNPIAYVEMTPYQGTDFRKQTAAISNHQPHIENAPRGDTIKIIYPGGTVRDILGDAFNAACSPESESDRGLCFEHGSRYINAEGVLEFGVAVRDDINVRFDAQCILFSMTLGVKTSYRDRDYSHPIGYQIYELCDLNEDEIPTINRLVRQPRQYNNFDAIYLPSHDQIAFVSDRPYNGAEHLYPHLDEYESAPVNSGLWKLNRENGDLTLMDASPSGVYSPQLSGDGGIYYIRWDHMQSDQQASQSLSHVIDPDSNADIYGAKNYESENSESNYVLLVDEIRRHFDNEEFDKGFDIINDNNKRDPHPSHPVYSDGRAEGNYLGTYNGNEVLTKRKSGKYGKENVLRFNQFNPWQIDQCGRKSETLRHFGRHETKSFFRASYTEDPAIRPQADNSTDILGDGLFHIKEHPAYPGKKWVATDAPEFSTNTSGAIRLITDENPGSGFHSNGNQLMFEYLTDPSPVDPSKPASIERYRNPLITNSGQVVASFDVLPESSFENRYGIRADFQLYQLTQDEDGFYSASTPLLETREIAEFTYFTDGNSKKAISGNMWEVGAVEIVPRGIPQETDCSHNEIPETELSILNELDIEQAELEDFLSDNNLALIVSRDVTKRDDADKQQPFNLRVLTESGDEGIQTVSEDYNGATIYDVTYLEIEECSYVRGYTNSKMQNGRRCLARPVSDEISKELNATSESDGSHSIKVEADGSIAAFVPADRALSWMTTDNTGKPVVRERFWIKFQRGEVRVCASCHGINEKDQAGNAGAPENSPIALRKLLSNWKNTSK